MSKRNRFSEGIENLKIPENEENITNAVSDSLQDNESKLMIKNILKNPIKNPGKSHSIYLSDDVSKCLIEMARKSKKSKSVIVDEILRAILL